MPTRPPLDLNLLPLLDALVQHRSATRAAAAMGLAQPQVSRALARLRAQTGDPLFVRRAGGLEPTQTALALAAACAPALRHAAALAAAKAPFDARSATDLFRLSMSDYESAALLPALFTTLRSEAPGTRMAVVSHPPGEVEHALEHGRIELAVGRFVKPRGTLRHVGLFEETLVAAVRSGHPLTRGRMTLARFVDFPHVLVSPGGRGEFRGLLDERLEPLGAVRTVVLSVNQFFVAPLVVARSDAVVMLPARLLRIVAAWGLVALPAPIEMPGFRVSMLWRERSQREPAHRWLRQRVKEAALAG